MGDFRDLNKHNARRVRKGVTSVPHGPKHIHYCVGNGSLPTKRWGANLGHTHSGKRRDLRGRPGERRATYKGPRSAPMHIVAKAAMVFATKAGDG